MTKEVALLMGGWSSERPVSLKGAVGVEKALIEKGYKVRPVDVTKDLPALVAALTPKPDAAFIMLHGPGGEDGVIQSVLEILEIPYTHSGVRASAAAMDKILTKQLAKSVGVNVAPHLVISVKDAAEKGIDFPKPYVVKPHNEGSSFGVTIVSHNEPDFDVKTWRYGDTMLVEQYIPGRELTVAILDGEPQTVCELRVHAGFYDFEAKYNDPRTEHVIPAPVSKEVFDLALEYSKKMYDVLGCGNVARCDFRYDDTKPGTEGLVFLEINTHPGFTATSLTPEQVLYHKGMDFADLCAHLVENASCGEAKA